MKELNKQVRKWGLIIRSEALGESLFSPFYFLLLSLFPFRCVSLSDIKILKQPEAIPGVGGERLLDVHMCTLCLRCWSAAQGSWSDPPGCCAAPGPRPRPRPRPPRPQPRLPLPPRVREERLQRGPAGRDRPAPTRHAGGRNINMQRKKVIFSRKLKIYMFCYFCSKCLFFIHHDCIALY